MFENIFNPFNETVFLKEDSTMDTDLLKLKEIRDKVKDKDKIDKDIKLIELGIKGEAEIAYELKNANLGLVVLRDITLEFEGNKAQIDYVIVSKGFTYFVECKNLIGNIYVDNNGQFTREYNYNGRKIKEGIYSPYTQALRHKEIFRKIWSNSHNSFVKLLVGSNFDTKWYKPLVVLSNSKALLYNKYAPRNIRNCTIRVDQLVSYIERDLANYDKDLLSNKKRMYSLAESFLDLNVTNNTSFVSKYINEIESSDNATSDNTTLINTAIENTSIENTTIENTSIDKNLGVVNKDNDELRSKLIDYRKSKSIKMNVPAFYIFTNDEFDKICELRPKTIEELSKILSPVKVKCHGKEIIDLINNL